jgi:hypothetical protein
MNIIEFLWGDKDALDELAAGAIRQMLRARSIESKSAEDAALAWHLAYCALLLISQNLKHYPFVPQETNAGWVVDNSGRIVEQSGSMSGEPLTEATVLRLSSAFLDGANELLKKHEEPISIADDAKCFPITDNQPVLQAAFEQALEKPGEASGQFWNRYHIVISQPPEDAIPILQLPAIVQALETL